MHGRIYNGYKRDNDVTERVLREGIGSDNVYFFDDGNEGAWYLWNRNSPLNYATMEDYVYKRNPLWIFTTAPVWYDDFYMGSRVICTDPDLRHFYVVFNQHTVMMNDSISVKLKGLYKKIFVEKGFHVHE